MFVMQFLAKQRVRTGPSGANTQRNDNLAVLSLLKAKLSRLLRVLRFRHKAKSKTSFVGKVGYPCERPLTSWEWRPH